MWLMSYSVLHGLVKATNYSSVLAGVGIYDNPRATPGGDIRGGEIRYSFQAKMEARNVCLPAAFLFSSFCYRCFAFHVQTSTS